MGYSAVKMNKIISCVPKGTELWMTVLSKIGRFTKVSVSSLLYMRFKKIKGYKIKRGKTPWGKREYWWWSRGCL